MRNAVCSRLEKVCLAAILSFSFIHVARAATFTEYAVPAPGIAPGDITKGPDGALWFTDAGFNAGIGRISTTGIFTEYARPFPPGPPQQSVAITPGPDGALWFTWSDGCDFFSGVTRITTQGVRSDQASTGDSCGYADITAGPNGSPTGSIWFTAALTPRAGSGDIIRISTDGSGSSFFGLGSDGDPARGIPFGSRFPVGITAGPDGALWFTVHYWFLTTCYIGRITTAGEITNFALPANACATLITSGPDGALWFLDANNIGRITTSGAVTEYTIPTENSNPAQIASGPDGAIWFTEHSGNKIGRITTAGVITEYTIPTANSGPTGITAGPDGAMWFTETDANKIGRLSLAAPTIAGLIASIQDPPSTGGSTAPLDRGVQNSLIAKLNAAQNSIDKQHLTPACSQLSAFVAELNAQIQAGQIDPAVANELLTGVAAIQSSLGCTQ